MNAPLNKQLQRPAGLPGDEYWPANVSEGDWRFHVERETDILITESDRFEDVMHDVYGGEVAEGRYKGWLITRALTAANFVADFDAVKQIMQQVDDMTRQAVRREACYQAKKFIDLARGR
jgi:hypothetical protein